LSIQHPDPALEVQCPILLCMRRRPTAAGILGCVVVSIGPSPTRDPARPDAAERVRAELAALHDTGECPRGERQGIPLPVEDTAEVGLVVTGDVRASEVLT